MNKVYLMGSNVPLTPAEISAQANALYRRKRPFTMLDFTGPQNRLLGTGHCKCNGNGEFELLPITHPDVQEGKKRYMICRKCGCWSHL